MATAKHRALDHLRRNKRLKRKHEEIGRVLKAEQERAAPALDATLDDDLGDDLLRLVFAACHPVLSTEARVALTLRLLGGLTTEEIARAFLVSEATVAQRIVRAKRTLADKQVPFEVPRGSELAARLSSVLEVIYLVFNEGYTATVGDDWMRPVLCDDALRLGRILAELAPLEPEVHGLVALMEIQASRSRAGGPIRRADRPPRSESVALGSAPHSSWSCPRSSVPTSSAAASGPYRLQAALAACHARARTPEETDWAHIAELYAELAELTPSPVVELNLAVAVAMAFGPAVGLELVDCADLAPAAAKLPPVADRARRLACEARGAATRHAASSSERQR